MTLGKLSQRKFPYTNKGISHLPYVDFLLNHGVYTSSKLAFLVDSGSVYSYAPYHYLVELGVAPDWSAAVATGCEDLSGKPLDGIPIRVKLMLAADPGIGVEETIYFRKSLNYAVLGHESFLRAFPALFYSKEKALTLFNLG